MEHAHRMSDNQSPPGSVQLRDVAPGDLPIFFEHQLDPQANYMAAFTAKDPADRQYFDDHWQRVLADTTITIRTIVSAGQVAGYVLSHSWFGEPEVSYWLGKAFWSRGIATQALAAFLKIVPTRPLFARAAKDNLASLRVLQKCGFKISGTARSYANARRQKIDEVLLTLS